jgi:hypothetical protein
MKLFSVMAASIAVLAASIVSAAAQTGPVARNCRADIAKMCADRPHDGSVRICLEMNYETVSAACKKALDTTGGGRGRGLGKGKGKGRAN